MTSCLTLYAHAIRNTIGRALGVALCAMSVAHAQSVASGGEGCAGVNPCTRPTGAFRRVNDPVQIALGSTAQPTTVDPKNFVDPSMAGTPGAPKLTSFMVVNPNRVWVRLKGFVNASDCANIGVTSTTGWLWPPGHVAVYSTQYPACVSAMAVAEPGYPLPTGPTWPDGTPAYVPLELSYGTGQ